MSAGEVFSYSVERGGFRAVLTGIGKSWYNIEKLRIIGRTRRNHSY